MKQRVIGTWLYQNCGGKQVGQLLAKKLKEREIDVIPDINLSNAVVTNGSLWCQSNQLTK